ncbi:MAG TPA: VOC family protein [Candidatus Saccharimonadia bacterium]|nr:VOC family protein [Candidatus Saccharimonadia bacterium]
MTRALAHVTVVVRDYDEAIAWYTQALDFVLFEDRPVEPGKRFVRVGPAGGAGASLLLARAANPVQEARIGDQTGGRVFLFLHTDDFARDHARLVRHGARFTGPPRHESYGTVAVFEDLYGNKWDLVEPRAEDATLR